MKKKNIEKLVALLEAAGYEGAKKLVHDDLIPFARKKHVSLIKAVELYADGTEEQNTSWYQLWEAKLNIKKSDLAALA